MREEEVGVLRKKRINTRGERGQTLIVAALFMAVVMGFTAMTIDVGLFLEDRRQLQNAADAAALAGVQHLPQQPDVARAKAEEWALNNGVPTNQIVSIEVQTTNYPNDTMYVKFTREFGWIFGRVLGKVTSDVPGSAKAVVGSLAGNHNMMPWALLQGDSACLDANGDAIYSASCVVKVGAGNAINGWYGALDYDGTGGGSAEYRANIVDGTVNTRYCVAGDTSPGCVTAVSIVDSLTGNKVGPTDQGIDERIATGGTPCDTNGNGKDDFDEIFKPNPNPGPTYVVACPDSPRIIIIPIVSYASEPVQQVTIRGWTIAYLDTYWCSLVANIDDLRGQYASSDPNGIAKAGKSCSDKTGAAAATPTPTATPDASQQPPAAHASALDRLYVQDPRYGVAPVPPLCHQGTPHGQQTCSTPTPTPTPAPTATPTPASTETPTATPADTPTPSPTPGGSCNGSGHWEVDSACTRSQRIRPIRWVDHHRRLVSNRRN